MADPELSFDAKPLLFPTLEVEDFINAYLAREDTCLLSEPVDKVSGRLPAFQYEHGAGLGWINYPPKPTMRLNQLYWPTGAGRWAEGYFLIDKETWDEIKADVWSGGNVAANFIFRINDVSEEKFRDETIETLLYALSPKRVSSISDDDLGEDEGQLLILPLVDERYFWQFKDLDDTEILDGTGGTHLTWAQVISAIATALDPFIGAQSLANSTISADYLKPDVKAFGRYENVAVTLDAIAHSLGMRLVKYLDGTLKLEDFTDAATVRDANLNERYALIAGEVTEREPVPAVRVIYPNIKNGELQGDVIAYEGTASTSLTVDTQATKVVYSTCCADVCDTEDTPDNDTALQTLADKITSDYHASLEKVYDYCFAGILDWKLCAWDDHILYQCGSLEDERLTASTNEVSKGNYDTFLDRMRNERAWTRVQSAPLNMQPSMQFSQDDSLFFIKIGYGRLWRATLNEDMGASESNEASADLLEMDGTDTNQDVTVKDPVGIFSTLENGDACLVVQQGCDFFLIQAPC